MCCRICAPKWRMNFQRKIQSLTHAVKILKVMRMHAAIAPHTMWVYINRSTNCTRWWKIKRVRTYRMSGKQLNEPGNLGQQLGVQCSYSALWKEFYGLPFAYHSPFFVSSIDQVGLKSFALYDLRLFADEVESMTEKIFRNIVIFLIPIGFLAFWILGLWGILFMPVFYYILQMVLYYAIFCGYLLPKLVLYYSNWIIIVKKILFDYEQK